MPKEKKMMKEKRKHERYSFKLDAQLKVFLSSHVSGMLIQGVQNITAMAETNNISIGGMSLRIVGSPMDAKKSLTPANASQLVGRPIEVLLDHEDIVVWGDVIRADAKALELAIVINKVSDVQRWKKLCSEKNDGISIFPDSLQIRRKRRS
jgi:hypothetical protein